MKTRWRTKKIPGGGGDGGQGGGGGGRHDDRDGDYRDHGDDGGGPSWTSLAFHLSLTLNPFLTLDLSLTWSFSNPRIRGRVLDHAVGHADDPCDPWANPWDRDYAVACADTPFPLRAQHKRKGKGETMQTECFSYYRVVVVPALCGTKRILIIIAAIL